MTDKTMTLARPYALAAFEYALEKNALPHWEAFLHTAARIVSDATLHSVLRNPELRQSELIPLFLEILGDITSEEQNFLMLLAEYNRLEVLIEIAKLFTQYRAHYEKTVTVELTSAVALDEPGRQKFIDALTRRLKRKVSLQCDIDEKLLGGAVIRAGDMVIDGSVRGKLNRLLESL